MARKRYDVVHRDALWCVTHNGETLKRYFTKSYAIDDGVQVARANAPSQSPHSPSGRHDRGRADLWRRPLPSSGVTGRGVQIRSYCRSPYCRPIAAARA